MDRILTTGKRRHREERRKGKWKIRGSESKRAPSAVFINQGVPWYREQAWQVRVLAAGGGSYGGNNFEGGLEQISKAFNAAPLLLVLS